MATSQDSPQVETNGPPNGLPHPICSVVGEVLGLAIYDHKKLESLFFGAGAKGEVPAGSCVEKCQNWLQRMHTGVENPVSVLAKVIEPFMDEDDRTLMSQEKGRTKIRTVLADSGYSYQKGGMILGSENALPTKALKQLLLESDIPAINNEFNRCVELIHSDAPAAITAACALVESLCKVYIEENNLESPKRQGISDLWKVTSKHLGFDASALEDDDLKKIVSGLNSVVGGIGSLRTHAGSAHGQGKKVYNVQARHARLAVHAAQTLVGYVLESWER